MEADPNLKDLKNKLSCLKVGEICNVDETSFKKLSEQETKNRIESIHESRLPPIKIQKPRVHLPGIKIKKEMIEKEELEKLHEKAKRLAMLQKIIEKEKKDNEEKQKYPENCCQLCGKAKILEESGGAYDGSMWKSEICSDPTCGIYESIVTNRD